MLPLDAKILPSSGLGIEPTANEQYMLQLVNRLRADPAAEGQRLLSIARTDPKLKGALSGWDASAFLRAIDAAGPQPPLAFNLGLIAAARDHDQKMVDANSQFHAPGGFVVTGAGNLHSADGTPYYPVTSGSWSAAENIFAYSSNLANPTGLELVDYFEEAFELDWGNPDFGHLRNLLSPGPVNAPSGAYPMSEIGIGILTGITPTAPAPSNPEYAGNLGLNVGPALVTQEFAYRSGHQFLEGAISTDLDANGFYSPGEGLGGVRIEAVGTAGQGTFSTVTWGSGGYSLDLPSGTFLVTATGGALDAPHATAITIGGQNVAWDVQVRPPTVVVPPPAPVPAPVVSESNPVTPPVSPRPVNTPTPIASPVVSLGNSAAKRHPRVTHVRAVHPVKHPILRPKTVPHHK